MNKSKEEDLQNLGSKLINNPLVMGIGALALMPDVIPIAIGAFVGYIISKSKQGDSNAKSKYEKQD